MATALDKDNIRRRLIANLEALCATLLPGGKKDGSEWVAGDVSGAPGRSLGVQLAGVNRGQWNDRADDGDQGDVFNLIGRCNDIPEFPDVLRWATDWLGDAPEPEPRDIIAEMRQADEDAKRRKAMAGAIWGEAMPIADSLAASYLASRGITIPLPGTLKYHRGLKHAATGQNFPALIALIQDPDGSGMAVQRTFLRLDGEAKAPIGNAKMALAPVKGGAIRLAPPAETLVVAEGVENALSVTQAAGMPTWAGIGSNIRNVVFPAEVHTVVIASDNDENGAGQGHAEALATRLIEEGRTVRLTMPTEAGKDWNDLLRAGEAGVIKELIEAAPVWLLPEPEPPSEAEDPGHDTDETDSEIARLAGLSMPAYERKRKAAAKRLDMRPGVLDKLVSAARPDDDRDEKTGRPVMPKETEPWPEPVDGATLLCELAEALGAFIVMSKTAADACALWAVHTHAIDACHYTGRLFLTSPTKRCGKTQLLKVISKVSARPLNAGNISSASFYRTIQATHGTLFVDEFDAHSKDDDEMRGAVNNGYERDNPIIRCDPNTFEPLEFDTFAPCAIAAIGRTWETVEDRSITIQLQRKRSTEKVKRLRRNHAPELDILARQAARWAADHMEAIRTAETETPEKLSDRAADIWEPLLAIADQAGGEWPARARAAAVALSADGVIEDQSYANMLLTDLQAFIRERSEEAYPTKIIIEYLSGIEERPWPAYGRSKKTINPKQLADILKPFAVHSNTIRTPTGTAKGYRRKDIECAASRYLANSAVTTSQPAETLEKSPNSAVTNGINVTGENGQKPRQTGTCDVVTAETPGNGEKLVFGQNDPDETEDRTEVRI